MVQQGFSLPPRRRGDSAPSRLDRPAPAVLSPMETGDIVRVEDGGYARIVDIGCRRVRVRRLLAQHEVEEMGVADVEVLRPDEALAVEVMES